MKKIGYEIKIKNKRYDAYCLICGGLKVNKKTGIIEHLKLDEIFYNIMLRSLNVYNIKGHIVKLK